MFGSPQIERNGFGSALGQSTGIVLRSGMPYNQRFTRDLQVCIAANKT